MKWYYSIATGIVLVVALIFAFGYLQHLPCYLDQARANDNAKCIIDCNEDEGCEHGCSDAYSCGSNLSNRGWFA